MKKKICVLAAVFSVSIGAGSARGGAERNEQGNIVTEGIPEIPSRIVDRMLQYQNTRWASIQDWDAAGKGMLISTRFAETNQLHYVEKPGGTRRQITFFGEPVGEARICPDPRRQGFLFTKDVGGSEFYQLFYFDLKGAEYKMLTDGSSRNGAMLWSNKGDRFVYYSTRRNGRDWDLFVSDIKKPNQAKPILQ
ncbi:MAG: TolB family protein, partial [Planctomycetota bacterium]